MTSQRSHVNRGIITKKLMHSNAYKLNYYGFILYSALLMERLILVKSCFKLKLLL